MSRIKRILKFSGLLLIIALICLAAEAEETRIMLAASGPMQYKLRESNRPPVLEINFTSRDVFARIEEETLVNQGLVRKVRVNYYARRGEEGIRALKSLRFYLTQPAEYQLTTTDNLLMISLASPPDLLAADGVEQRQLLIELTEAPSLEPGEADLLKSLIAGELLLREEGELK